MFKRICAFALALMMIPAMLSCVAETEQQSAERTVLMTVGGVPIYQDDVEYYMQLTQMYYQYGMLPYYYDKLDSLQYLLYYDAAAKLLTDGKVEALLKDSYDELAMQYGTQFDGYVDERVAEIKGEEGYSGTDEEAYEQALEYFNAVGYTRESYIQEALTTEAYNVYLESIEVNVTDEEVRAAFDRLADADRQMYEGSLENYENYVMRRGYTSYYTPEGYRGILHILLPADEALLESYKNAAEGEEKQAAAAAVVASIQDTIDEIYAAYEAGTPFVDLIAKYNTDPGMTDESNLASGYQVHKDGTTYMKEFTDGSFSEGMDEPGDISKPVVTSYGVHILYYLSDIPGGIAEMTDEIASSIREDLEGEARYNKVVEELKQYEVVYLPAYDEFIGEKNFLDD